MPVPEIEVFDRLRTLVAIDAAAARPPRKIDEIFPGEPLGSVPIGPAGDAAEGAEVRAGLGYDRGADGRDRDFRGGPPARARGLLEYAEPQAETGRVRSRCRGRRACGCRARRLPRH
ncbi:hypothetical protein AB0H42_08745 [Nocardia sp. NPDC050799]|uniref:hypothetical protein n=1 Tax=Nocardia sp. NPDC050799 TaxID=3154842 RepID=UPI0033C74112